MEAVRETTGGLFPAHTYLLDGTTLIAYIKSGDSKPFYFKSGIKGFDKRGRTFERTDADRFKAPETPLQTSRIEVKGSKGNTYIVDPEAKTCTCPGFTFRGACKHTADLE